MDDYLVFNLNIFVHNRRRCHCSGEMGDVVESLLLTKVNEGGTMAMIVLNLTHYAVLSITWLFLSSNSGSRCVNF